MAASEFSEWMLYLLICFDSALMFLMVLLFVLLSRNAVDFFGRTVHGTRERQTMNVLVTLLASLIFIGINLYGYIADEFEHDTNSFRKSNVSESVEIVIFAFLYILVYVNYVILLSRINSFCEVPSISKSTMFAILVTSVMCAAIILLVLSMHKFVSTDFSMVLVALAGFGSICVNMTVLWLSMGRLYFLIKQLQDDYEKLLTSMVIIGQDQENRNSRLNPSAIPKRNYDAKQVDDITERLNHNGSAGSGILDYMIKISVVIMVCSIFQSIWIVFAILNYVEIH